VHRVAGLFALTAVVLAGCARGPQQVTLRILALNWPQAKVEQALANKRFTPESGIRVEIEQNSYDSVEVKMKHVITSHSDQYDIVHYDSQWLGEFVAAGGLERLDAPQYLRSPSARISFDDFIPEYATVVGKYPTDADEIFAGRYGQYEKTPIYGLPWATGCQILFYRRDLLQEAGFNEPPQTWPEFVQMAKAMTRNGVTGAWTHASRKGDYITQDFFPILWANGGRLWNAKTWRTRRILNSPANIRALQFYVDWNLKYHIVPPASADWTNEEVFNAAAQGTVGMGQFWATFGAFLEDPSESRVVGKMDYSPVPGFRDEKTGQIRRAAMQGSQGTAITSYSKHKKEAWQYLQWLLSRETQKAILDVRKSAFVCCRKDLNDYTRSRNPRNAAVLASTKFVHDFWNTPDYSKMLDIIQRELNLAFIGAKSPKAALDTAAEEIQQVLDSSPRRPRSGGPAPRA
jgi:multiple sugar transport system substrate-binding protein